MAAPRPVRAPRGSALTARGWPQEAALRMLQNNLDPEVAEHPDQLVVYGGTGKAARDWRSFDAMVATLRTLGPEETMLVQSGRPVGVMTTHEWAPRVLIANSNLVGEWANWEEFRHLERLGLTMYGQMTAGSWIYIGTQGILQGTYETFAAVAAQRFPGGSLAGTITLTAGLGGMGGAQPLAVTMNGGVAVCVDCDPRAIARRIEHGYLDVQAESLQEALDLAVRARDARRPLSVGLLGNAAEIVPELLRIGAPIDIVTDQTSAHDPLAYLPIGVDFADMADYAAREPAEFTDRARESMARHVEAMVAFQDAGAEVFDYGNSIRGEARLAGYERAFAFPGFVPAYIRPLFCEGKGPFRWVALSGDPRDIAVTDRAVLDLFPENESLARWIRLAGERVRFQGLPARICWLGYGERDRAGERFNDMVAGGELSGPVVIGRDHLDCGSVASPYRETEAMRDGSDAIADWPLLNAMVNVASGASWVSIHHGGGVGMGRSIHAGQVTVADGTPLAAEKIRRVLTNDPGMGVIRHVDAGYETAAALAAERGVRVPMRGDTVKTLPGAETPKAPKARETSGTSYTFWEMWRGLLTLGRAAGGGYRRFSHTSVDAELRAWFRAEARARGMSYEVDRNGNDWAWAGDPARGEAVVTGSHLDSVPDGGAFDGPLGVVSAFGALDELRARGAEVTRPIGVVRFAEEEGARFGVSCLGSRLACGLLDPAEARRLTDSDGVTLASAMERSGLDSAAIGPDPERLARLGAFVELHIEQGRALVELGRPVGVGLVIWPHGRWRFDFHGEANHAGTTRVEDRRDPMLTYANTVLTARKRARLAGALATFGKVAVEPGAVNAVPALVSGWLDARAADSGTLDELVSGIERTATERGGRDGVRVAVTRESHTPGVEFDPALRDRLAARLGDAPLLPTGAGHDAGILSTAVPTAMLYVRNSTGVSHAPAEHAEESDCLAGRTALADVLEELVCH